MSIKSMSSLLYIILFHILANFYVIVNAEIQSMKQQTIDFSGKLLSKDFGMATNGIIDVNYDIAPYNSSAAYSSYILINIVNSKQREFWYSSLEREFATISSQIASQYCTQPAMFRQTAFGVGNFSYVIPAVDQYSVVVIQCRDSGILNPISVSVSASLKNIRPSSDGYSHLPIDEVMIPRVLEGSSIIESLFIVGLGGQMYFGRYVAVFAQIMYHLVS
jgi:hypothetical protein